MKINYRYEDHKSMMGNIIMITIILLMISVITISQGYYKDIGCIIFTIILNLSLIISLIFSVKDYIKRKKQRNLNLFTIKKGKCIKGKIVSIYDNITMSYSANRSYHNISADISYNIDGEEKRIIVDRLLLKPSSIKKYENKIIKIYIYINMSYIDIVN